MALQSSEVPTPPKEYEALRVWLKKVLQAHYEDIKMLYLTTTDYDPVEKQQEDISRS